MSEAATSGNEQGPVPEERERVQALVRQLAAAEAALASATNGVDSVIDPATATPILLRQAQADLAASEERYNRLVAAMAAVVFELTPNGRVLFVNDAITTVTGYRPRDMLGRSWAKILTPGDLFQGAVELGKRIRAGDVAGYELTIAARDGSRVVVEINSANHYAAGGALLRIVGIATNITARKRAEEALAQHAEHLQRLNAEVEESRRQLQAYSRRLIKAVENERRNIARELHDQANQLLTSLMLGLNILEKRYGGSEEAARHLDYLQQIGNDLSKCMHNLAVTLRPASLDRLGLSAGLRQLAEMIKEQAHLDIDLLTVGLNGHRLDPVVEITVYRIVQEALTNVARHAQATHAGVVVQRKDDRIVAIIEDDGAGFDVRSALGCDPLGLLGMRERAEMLGGALTIESTPGGGTTVYADIPCPDQR